MAAHERWRYLVVDLKPDWMGRVRNESLQGELDRHGAQGWELVQVMATQPMRGARLVFKRAG